MTTITTPMNAASLLYLDNLVADQADTVSIQMGGSSAATAYFKMRALADPGPGYVVWVVTTSPDPSGTHAPSPIQPGTASVAATWSV